jgi:hypothetical protein
MNRAANYYSSSVACRHAGVALVNVQNSFDHSGRNILAFENYHRT